MPRLIYRRLALSPIDVKFISDLKYSNGMRFFREEPCSLHTRYEFLCGIKPSAEEVIIRFQDGRCHVFGTDHTLGTIQWHFPDHEWDARLAVKGVELRTNDYQDASTTVAGTLSITPSPDGETVTMTAELPTGSGLYFKSVTARRELVFQCDTNSDLLLVCTEISMVGETVDNLKYANSMKDKATMRNDGELWWEIRLISKRASDLLQKDQDLAADLIEAGVLRRLYDLTWNVVSRIDSIGGFQGSTKSGTPTKGSSFHIGQNPADSQGGVFW